MKLPPFTREEIAFANRKVADIARTAGLLADLQRQGVDLTPGPGLTARIVAALKEPTPRISTARVYRTLESQNPCGVNLAARMSEGFDRIPAIAEFSRQREEADRMTTALLDNLDAYKRVPS